MDWNYRLETYKKVMFIMLSLIAGKNFLKPHNILLTQIKENIVESYETNLFFLILLRTNQREKEEEKK